MIHGHIFHPLSFNVPIMPSSYCSVFPSVHSYYCRQVAMPWLCHLFRQTLYSYVCLFSTMYPLYLPFIRQYNYIALYISTPCTLAGRPTAHGCPPLSLFSVCQFLVCIHTSARFSYVHPLTLQAGGVGMAAFSFYLFVACQVSRLYSDVWVR